MPKEQNPVLYQINTRVWLNELAARKGKVVTLMDISDEELDGLQNWGFDWIWLVGVWQTGSKSRDVARQHPDLRPQYFALLPDLKEEEICASPFSVQAYSVHQDFGTDAALASFRNRLRRRGMKLLLDFVPNHTGLDHAWLVEHPEWYVAGTESLLEKEPQNYRRVTTGRGEMILAYGRDPYFPGWSDTVQLNYRHPGLRAAMTEELTRIATKCDGVRCDMAMLILSDIFLKTWGTISLPWDCIQPVDTPFWYETILAVKNVNPQFVFMAEAYWDREWELQQQGFDFTYDKRFYDRLVSRDAHAVRGHLHAEAEYQQKSVRFLENHDEPRAAQAILPAAYEATAVVAFLVPGMRFFHEGQFVGKHKRLLIQLSRRPVEIPDKQCHAFYQQLFRVLKSPESRGGQWHLFGCRPAWQGNESWGQFLAFGWHLPDGRRLLIAVNFGPLPGQCYVNLPIDFLHEPKVLLRDLMHPVQYEREQLSFRGLYLDMPAWGYHVFAVEQSRNLFERADV